MSTPEGKVKAKISALLKKYAPGVYYEMPVPGGFGKSGLDYTGCYLGRFFAVEAKAPGKKPTGRQEVTIAAIRHAHGMVFVIDGPEGLAELERWLKDPKKNELLP
jgi:hypothetical protein